MKKTALLILLIIHIRVMHAQPPTDSLRLFHHQAGVGVTVPAGDFQKTHPLGGELHYQWSRTGIGYSYKPNKLITFTAGGGFSYFIGKREAVQGRSFRFDDYLYSHLSAGAMLHPAKSLYTSAMIGPGIGIYGGNSRFGFTGLVNAGLFVSERIVLGLQGQYRKHEKTNALWSGSIRASYAF